MILPKNINPTGLTLYPHLDAYERSDQNDNPTGRVGGGILTMLRDDYGALPRI